MAYHTFKHIFIEIFVPWLKFNKIVRNRKGKQVNDDFFQPKGLYILRDDIGKSCDLLNKLQLKNR